MRSAFRRESWLIPPFGSDDAHRASSGLLWVTGGKTPSEYIFSELPQVADIAKSAFHRVASLLVSQTTAFWVRAIPGEL